MAVAQSATILVRMRHRIGRAVGESVCCCWRLAFVITTQWESELHPGWLGSAEGLLLSAPGCRPALLGSPMGVEGPIRAVDRVGWR